MKNISPGQPETPGEGGVPLPHLQALRICESRIKDLQELRPSGRQEALSREARLRREVGSAVDLARLCTTTDDFRRASSATLAGMINSYSKMRAYPISRGVDAVVACIEQEVARRAATGSLIHWPAKHLVLVTNGISKCQGPQIPQGLTHMARTLVAAGPLTLDRGWNAQHLAMMANGLSKAEGHWIQEALTHLAKALPPVRQMTVESGWGAQHLAMMANGLSKGEGTWIRSALTRLAQTISRQDLSLHQGWGAQALAMMANGLGKGDGPAVRDALAQLARAVPEPLSLTPKDGWQPRHLAMVTCALGKGEGADVQQALTRLAFALSAMQPLGPESGWSAQLLAMMTHGLAKGEGQAVRSALAHLARAVLSVQPLTVDQGWTPERLALVANGLAKGEGRDIQRALTQLARSLLVSGPQASWSLHLLAIMANGLSRGEGPCIRQALSWLARHSVCQLRQGAAGFAWNARDLAMLANALTRGEGEDIARALTSLAQALLREGELTPDSGWTARRLALMASALGQGEGADVLAALTQLARSLLAAGPLAQAFWPPQSLAMMASGLSKGEGRCIQEALGLLAREAVCQLRQEATASVWNAQDLAMLASALAKGEGPDILDALASLAQALLRERQLTPEAGWTARDLAMVANALVKAQGEEGRAALTHLARSLLSAGSSAGLSAGSSAGSQVAAGSLASQSWSPQYLAMMANALSKEEGPCIREALDWLARETACRLRQGSALSAWSAQDLAMMANGLSKGQGDDISMALTCLAEAVPDDGLLKEEQGWIALSLSMMTYGLGRGESKGVQRALTRLARAIEARDLVVHQGWGCQELAMTAAGLAAGAGVEVHRARVRLAETACQWLRRSEQDWEAWQQVLLLKGTGQTLVGPDVLGTITSALVHTAWQEPQALIRALDCLSRFALAPPHLECASRLLAALRSADFSPCSRRDRDELLWSTTLLHFGCQQQQPIDQVLAASFAQFSRQLLSCTQALEEAAGVPLDLWHSRWASDYWQPAVRGAGAPRAAGRAAGSAVRVSSLQNSVFKALRAQMPDSVVQLEVPVNHFPVDIMIEGRLCIEVDGPWHFVEVPAEGGGEPGADSVETQCAQTRRTRDLFVDHMLRHYGYQVFRFVYGGSPGELDRLVGDARAALACPPQDHDERQRQPDRSGILHEIGNPSREQPHEKQRAAP